MEFEENLIDEEQAFLIHQFLHNMEESYKEVFNLRGVENFPMKRSGCCLEQVPGG